MQGLRMLVVSLVVNVAAAGCGSQPESTGSDEYESSSDQGSSPADGPAAAVDDEEDGTLDLPEVLLAPEAETLPPEPPVDEWQLALDARLSALRASFHDSMTVAIVEGVVVEQETVLLDATDSVTFRLATKTSVDVARSWKSGVSENVVIWSYGGALPADYPDGPYPREERVSDEVYPKPGERIVFAFGASVLSNSVETRFRVRNGSGGLCAVPHANAEDAFASAVVASVYADLDATFDRFEVSP